MEEEDGCGKRSDVNVTGTLIIGAQAGKGGWKDGCSARHNQLWA